MAYGPPRGYVGHNYARPMPVHGGVMPYVPPPRPFIFDGGAGSYFLVGLGATLLTVLTLGLAYPWAATMFCRWQTEHTIVNGCRLRFTGNGFSLFGHYIKWWFFCLITLGFYSFWLVPRMTRWKVENQAFGYAA